MKADCVNLTTTHKGPLIKTLKSKYKKGSKIIQYTITEYLVSCQTH